MDVWLEGREGVRLLEHGGDTGDDKADVGAGVGVLDQHEGQEVAEGGAEGRELGHAPLAVEDLEASFLKGVPPVRHLVQKTPQRPDVHLLTDHLLPEEVDHLGCPVHKRGVPVNVVPYSLSLYKQQKKKWSII